MYAQRELFQFRCVQAVTSGAEASHFQESVPSGRRSRRKNRECAGSFGSGHRTIRSSIGMCIALEKKKRVYRRLHLFQLLWLTIGHVELEVHVAWTM